MVSLVAAEQITTDKRPALKLAYVMTHYPRVALTFIAGEIDEMERRGAEIFPIVMNAPGSSDLGSDEALERHRRSLYLKASPGRIVTETLALFLRHPSKMSSLALTAIRSARWDVRLIARRLVHLGYGSLAARHCRMNGIGHLHAQFGLAPATIAWFACSILNFNRGSQSTWSFTIHGFQDFIEEADARLDLKAASASFVVCISDFTRSQLCRVTDPRLWGKFHVVRCGIDLLSFSQRPSRPMRSVPRVVIVGRLSPEKGHGILLEAVSKLATDNKRVEVEIIGDGPFAEAIRGEERELGIADQIIHAGELLPDEVARRLTDADIFCMASFSEGLPISIMEAMAVGVPVVTTWIGGIPELAVNEVTAMTVPPGNSEALAEGLKRLLLDPQLCDRLIAQGRAAVERMHSRKANGKQLFELFEATVAPKVPE